MPSSASADESLPSRAEADIDVDAAAGLAEVLLGVTAFWGRNALKAQCMHSERNAGAGVTVAEPQVTGLSAA